MINIYSVPAIFALVAKLFILYFSRRAKIQNLGTRLFALAVVFAIALSLIEAIGFNYGLHSVYRDWFGFAYFAALIPLSAVLAHLSILISFSSTPRYVPLFIYSYVLILEALLLFTPLLLTGFESLGGYTITRIPGPLHGLFELFALLSMLSMGVLPFFGLRASQPITVRSRCKLWIVAATPLALLNILIVVLLHFKIYVFNMSVTTPLLFTLLLAAIGYAVHNKRLIELDFYLPWSRTRKYKTELYTHVRRLTRDLPQLASSQEIIERLADTLRCPVSLVFRHNSTALNAGAYNSMVGFPKTNLMGLAQMTVARELDESQHELQLLMKYYQIGVIVPFFFHSRIGACWLLLGETFNKQIYTPLDFKVVNQLFDKLAMLLLDQVLAAGMKLAETKRELHDLKNSQQEIRATIEKLFTRLSSQETKFADDKPLDAYLSEFEALIIEHALEHCHGNRARAARLLGLRPNTLHYKLKRYEATQLKK